MDHPHDAPEIFSKNFMIYPCIFATSLYNGGNTGMYFPGTRRNSRMLLRERLCAGYGPLPPWVRFGNAPVISTTLMRCYFNAALPRVYFYEIPTTEYQHRAWKWKHFRGRVKNPVPKLGRSDVSGWVFCLPRKGKEQEENDQNQAC